MTDRKAATAAYRERKTVPGIFAIRCAAGGQVWVGRAPDISTIRNRIWFTLRGRATTRRDLQLAWDSHGEAAFAFEVLEELDHDLPDFARAAALADRQAHWIDRLGAGPV